MTALARAEQQEREGRASRDPALRALLDPADFARRILRHDVWWTPAEILRSVAWTARTAVKACHASSKTFTAAEAVIWWVTRFHDGIVITTAPTWTQVERLMWGEIQKAASGALIQYPVIRSTELRLSKSNYAIGISTNEGVRFQGWHGKVLIVIDEALGVKPPIWEAIEGMRAGGDVRVLALGNPVAPGGPFYDAHARNREMWSTFTIDGLDTPNTVACGSTVEERLDRIVSEGKRGNEHFLLDNPRPYLITRKYIYEKYREWGVDNPLWQGRVRGQFPLFGENMVFSLAWLDRSRYLDAIGRDPSALVDIGIDVAGPGDDETVVYIIQGYNVLGMFAYSDRDPRGAVLRDLMPFRGLVRKVKVDVVGIGYYFAQHLRDAGFDVDEVNVSEAPVDRKRFADRKAEIYWMLREKLEAGLAIGITDEKTISQLSTIKWEPNSQGQIVIESKQKMRERGLESPDRAEALILAFASDRPFQNRAPVPPSSSYRSF